MSYIANLVHRTLGVTPVAQPVIQARFAPQSQQVTVGGQDSGVAQTTVLAPSKPEASPIVAQSRTISAQPEIPVLRAGKGTSAGHSPVFSEPSSADPTKADQAVKESQPVLPPVRNAEDSGLQPPNLPALAVTVQAQAPEMSDRPQHPAHAVDEFRLMQPTPPALGLRPSSSTSRPASVASFSQSREMESAERPVVRVHIGRVDVRMVTPGTKEPRAALPTVPDAKPASLEEYLQARQRGTR